MPYVRIELSVDIQQKVHVLWQPVYGLDDWEIEVRVPVGNKNFLVCIAGYLHQYIGYWQGLLWSGCRGPAVGSWRRPLALGAQIKNGWSYASMPHKSPFQLPITYRRIRCSWTDTDRSFILWLGTMSRLRLVAAGASPVPHPLHWAAGPSLPTLVTPPPHLPPPSLLLLIEHGCHVAQSRPPTTVQT